MSALGTQATNLRTRALPTSQALYTPEAIRTYADNQDGSGPLGAALDIERFRQRLNVHADGNEQLNGQRILHSHFCLKPRDRLLAAHEGLRDVHDAVTGISRLADVLFVGFAVRPDWNSNHELSLEGIHIEQVFSRQLQQNPRYREALDKLERIVREDLAFPHIYGFPSRLDTVTNGSGYLVNKATHRILSTQRSLASTSAIKPEKLPWHPFHSWAPLKNDLHDHRCLLLVMKWRTQLLLVHSRIQSHREVLFYHLGPVLLPLATCYPPTPIVQTTLRRPYAQLDFGE
ncbi:hypothetical protein PHLCEN_2v2957, partial [Hermanssonia centrifuga]